MWDSVKVPPKPLHYCDEAVLGKEEMDDRSDLSLVNFSHEKSPCTASQLYEQVFPSVRRECVWWKFPWQLGGLFKIGAPGTPNH